MLRSLLIIIVCFSITSCVTPQHSQSTENIDIQLIKAYCYEKTGHRKLANQTYLDLIRYTPDSGAAHNNYGAFLCHTGRYRKGVQQFLLAAHNRAYPKKEMAYHNAVLCEKKE